MWSGGYATHDLLIIVSCVGAEPDFTVPTLTNLPMNPELVYHPCVTLRNGVRSASHSNGTVAIGSCVR